jgi:hypothetical protein
MMETLWSGEAWLDEAVLLQKETSLASKAEWRASDWQEQQQKAKMWRERVQQHQVMVWWEAQQRGLR